jgi:acyl carrier protein
VNDAEIYAELTEIFHEAFDDDGIVLQPEMTAADIAGWDSVKMVTIIIAVEEKFDIKMRSRDIDRMKCVGDFVELIKAAKAKV